MEKYPLLLRGVIQFDEKYILVYRNMQFAQDIKYSASVWTHAVGCT